MLKVGDRVKCIKEEDGVYIELGEIAKVVRTDEKDIKLDIEVMTDSGNLMQWASSKKFVKVEY